MYLHLTIAAAWRCVWGHGACELESGTGDRRPPRPRGAGKPNLSAPPLGEIGGRRRGLPATAPPTAPPSLWGCVLGGGGGGVVAAQQQHTGVVVPAAQAPCEGHLLVTPNGPLPPVHGPLHLEALFPPPPLFSFHPLTL